jgi:hypothetical protein
MPWEDRMSTIQQQITENFLSKLALSKDVEAETIAALRKLLSDGRKPKADEIVKIFTHPAGSDLE